MELDEEIYSFKVQLRCFKTKKYECSANVINVLERSLFENFRNISNLFFFFHKFFKIFNKKI
jgi:hypothetical protein